MSFWTAFTLLFAGCLPALGLWEARRRSAKRRRALKQLEDALRPSDPMASPENVG